jgi:hypothetical protein
MEIEIPITKIYLFFTFSDPRINNSTEALQRRINDNIDTKSIIPAKNPLVPEKINEDIVEGVIYTSPIL